MALVPEEPSSCPKEYEVAISTTQRQALPHTPVNGALPLLLFEGKRC